MRALLPLLLLVLLGVAARGQQQEKLVDRLLKKPDSTLTYDMRKSAFGMDRTVSSKGAPVKAFTGEKTFASRTFDAKTYSGTQEAWMANSKFATKEASTRKFAEGDRAAPVKTMPVNTAREAGKVADTHTSQEMHQHQAENSRFLHLYGPPTNLSDLTYDGELKPMSIEDIRTLLNKNK